MLCFSREREKLQDFLDALKKEAVFLSICQSLTTFSGKHTQTSCRTGPGWPVYGILGIIKQFINKPNPPFEFSKKQKKKKRESGVWSLLAPPPAYKENSGKKLLLGQHRCANLKLWAGWVGAVIKKSATCNLPSSLKSTAQKRWRRWWKWSWVRHS